MDRAQAGHLDEAVVGGGDDGVEPGTAINLIVADAAFKPVIAGLARELVVVTAAVENDVPEALRARTVRVVAGTIQAEDADE